MSRKKGHEFRLLFTLAGSGKGMLHIEIINDPYACHRHLAAD